MSRTRWPAVAGLSAALLVGGALVAAPASAVVADTRDGDEKCVAQPAQPAVEEEGYFEDSGWVTEPLDAPWALTDTRTVIDQEAVEEQRATRYLYKRWEVTQEYVPGVPAVEEEGHFEYAWYPKGEQPEGWEYAGEKEWVVTAEAVPPTFEDVVTHVEYRKWKILWWDYKWFPVEAKPNKSSGWKATGKTKTEQVMTAPGAEEQGYWSGKYRTWVVDVPAQEAVPEIPEEGEWVKEWSDEERGEPWTLVRTKEVVTQEAVEEVSHEEYRYQRWVVTQEAREAQPEVRCEVVVVEVEKPVIIEREVRVEVPAPAPAPAPAPVAVSAEADPAVSGEVLASTGATSAPLALSALGLVGLGAAGVIARRVLA